jgi:PAS domain S-box-containing protein
VHFGNQDMVKDLDLPGGERWIDSERRLRAVYDGVALGIAVVDLSDRILDGNRAFYGLLGYRAGELRLRRFDDLPFPSDAVALRVLVDELLIGRRLSFVTDLRLVTKDGGVFWARVTSSLVHDAGETSRYRVIAVEDISARVAADAERKAEREALAEQLLRAQRMEIVGRFAGTIAHDFNNLLTVIRTNSEFILRCAGQDAEQHDRARHAEEIRHAADRASAVTRQLLSFCRRQPTFAQVVDVNEIVREMEPFLGRLIGEDVGLGLRLGGAPAIVRMDVTRLQQVVLNVAVNARDAMPQGGSFIIETSHELAVPGPSATDAGQRRSAGRYVRLSLSHSGASIPEDVQPFLCDPLFDTAPPSRGTSTALGLPMIRTIVAESGGFIRVRSSLGHGTTVDVYIPSADAGAAVETIDATTDEFEGNDAPLRGSETVLLVEDDDAVRRVARRALEGAGYSVLQAGNGTDAIKIAAEYNGEIHLSLTDVVMPGISGPACVEQITMTRPNVPAVYISGYADDILEEHGVIARARRFVRKPFTPGELTRVIRDVLD